MAVDVAKTQRLQTSLPIGRGGVEEMGIVDAERCSSRTLGCCSNHPKSWQELASEAHWPPAAWTRACARVGPKSVQWATVFRLKYEASFSLPSGSGFGLPPPSIFFGGIIQGQRWSLNHCAPLNPFSQKHHQGKHHESVDTFHGITYVVRLCLYSVLEPLPLLAQKMPPRNVICMYWKYARGRPLWPLKR